ncbi:MAG: proton-conducting transporter transmembrane domain-containing protein [Symbiobacteriia bacterium]
MFWSQAVVAGLFRSTLALYIVGALAGLWPGQLGSGAEYLVKRRRFASRLGHTLALLAGVTGTVAAVAVLLNPALQVAIGIPLRLPLSTNQVRLDTLSAFFVLIISLGSLSASLYAPSYLHSYEDRKPTGWLAAGYNLFVLAMVLVVTAPDAVLFLVAWELMSTLSYLLVMTDHEDPAVRHAGFIYLVMTHAGTAFITSAFLILGRAAGSADFAQMLATAGGLTPGTKTLVFLFLLVGFGTKAGLIPLHVWLPRAHPAAPSHVSALMSGVMVKTAIYGLLRLVFLVLGGGPLWWSGLLMGLGLISAILGVLYALMETDLKRLLAFSTIENVGIILTGLGAAAFARGLGQSTLASILATAALLHALNHALFKGLLFEAVGSVHHATHTRNLEQLGGLIRRMPQTAMLFLGGTIAIAALPPSNGFLSEFMTLKGLLMLGAAQVAPAARLAALLAATGLAFTGALAAAAFVKAFGISFLGMPRSERAEQAHEAPAGMRAAMWLLLALCLIIGLVPGPVLSVVNRVGVAVTVPPAGPESHLPEGVGTLTPLLAVSLAAAALLAFGLARLWSKRRAVRVTDPWACGIDLQPEMQYSGGALVKPLRIFFRGVLRPESTVTREDAGSPYFPTLIRYEGSLAPVYERNFYFPFRQALVSVSNRLRRIQTGSVQSYLAYIAATLAILLILAR